MTALSKVCAIVATVAFMLAMPAASLAVTPSTVIIVRHGEKASGDGDVPLTSAGQERARALARMLADAGVKSIYTSQTKRTQDTARPLAEQLHVAPHIIRKGQLDEVVKQLRATRPGETTLLVWHVDELPEIVDRLGGTLAEYGDQEYDRLVILTLIGGNAAKVLTLRYGNK